MLSRSSLKDELIAKCDRVKASADRGLLKRWIAKADQELWQSFFQTIGVEHTAEVIGLALQARRSARASVDREYGTYWVQPGGTKRRVPGFNEAWTYALPAIRKNIAEKLDVLPLSLDAIQAATFLEGKADYIRNLHRSYFGYADHLGLPDGPKFKLSRKSRAGSPKKRSIAAKGDETKMTRPRTLFAQIVAGRLSAKFGKPFTKIVAALTEIAFPGEALDVENVHNAIKTRSRRKPLPKR